MKEFANVAARAVAWVVLIAAVWVMSTSLLFLWLGDLLGDPRIAPWQRPYVWFLYLPLAGRDLMETLYLILAPLPLPALAIAIMMRRRSFGPRLRLARSFFGPSALTLQRGVTDNHGHADWLPIAVAARCSPVPVLRGASWSARPIASIRTGLPACGSTPTTRAPGAKAARRRC